MQISAEISDGAPGQRALKKTGNQYDTGEGIGRHRGIAAECAARPATAGFAGLRIDREFEDQTGRWRGEQPGEHKEDVAPAKQVAEHPAGGLTEQLAENLSGNVPPEDLLQPVVRRHVTDIGH